MFILLVGFLLQFLEYDDPISMMLSIIDPYDWLFCGIDPLFNSPRIFSSSGVCDIDELN